MDFPLNRLPEIFRIPGFAYTIESIQSGHINTTFRILNGNKPVYILQKVNVDIFKDIEALMSNYQVVVDSFKASPLPAGQKLIIPEIIKTQKGRSFYTDEQSGHWRLITYLKGVDGNNILRDENTSYQGGLAFGALLKGLSEINPGKLNIILPDFHSLERRFGEFQNALEKNASNRKPGVEQEIEFVISRFKTMMKIPALIDQGDIPIRLVHNDTKLSNVIYNNSGNATGVIDLDTVMPGSALFDFGDAIRSCANPAAEDEPDLSKVNFDIDLFKSFSKGYLETAGTILTKTEIQYLPESALLLTFIIGMRFLTDFLNGDIYYQTNYHDHNLIRARVQFRLLSQMEFQLKEMHLIISTYSSLFSSEVENSLIEK